MSQAHQTIGPPGTGKTTAVLDTVRALVNDGYNPEQVAVVSFTKAAVREAQGRIEEEFAVDLGPRDGGKVGTIHSLCYWGLGVSALGGIFGRKEWTQFCKENHIAFSTTTPNDDDAIYDPWEPAGQAEGDVFLSWYGWARNACLGLEEAAQRYNPGYGIEFYPSRALRLTALYEEAKAKSGKPDFGDLLAWALRDNLALGARTLLVDEAQDLSVLQRRVVEMWSQQADHTAYFFDPDQCIYSWQAADPQWLLDMDAERTFLAQSYRVPQRVASLANNYIARNKGRFNHQFLPTDIVGAVHWGCTLDEIVARLARTSASWGLLARNRFLLSHYTEPLLAEGTPYVNLRGRSPLSRLPSGVLAALRLARGEAVALRDLKALSDLTPVAGFWFRGAKANLGREAALTPEAPVNVSDLPSFGATSALVSAMGGMGSAMGCLAKLPADRRDFYLRLVERGGMEALLQKPQVTVSTIHGVKGREFDNVVMLPDWARRTADGADEDVEAERRVWYVGMTRARHNLYFLEPHGRLWNDEIA